MEYPDQNEFDERLYNSLQTLPDGSKINIEFVKQTIWNEAVSYNIPREKVIRGNHSNMFTIEAMDENGKIKNVVVKRVVPKELRAWKTSISNVQLEIKFYSSLKDPEHAVIRNLFPKTYYSAGTSEEINTDEMNSAFCLILEDLNSQYYQTPVMDYMQSKHVLDGLAILHANFWGQASHLKRGSFWVLENRMSLLDGSDQTWRSFIDRFPELEKNRPRVRELGAIIKNLAVPLDNFVDAGGNTRIHGDAKGWNLFFAKEGAERPFIFIDMEWSGRGHPMQDVAYVLTTTCDQESLGKMDELVDYYVTKLDENLIKNGVTLDKAELRSEFDTVWLDYVRIIMMLLWKILTPEIMEKNKGKVGPSMINQSWYHIEFIVNKLYGLLIENPDKLKVKN